MSYTDRIRAWVEVEDASQAFLLTGLRREIGPSGDLDAAHRDWYARYTADHHAALERMCTEFNRRWRSHV